MSQFLNEKKCKPCEGGVSPLSKKEAENLLKQLDHWTLNPSADEIKKTVDFKNYYHTISFVNAIAWIANHENHHPDLEVGYKRCVVRFTTHAIKGLSENDFICAAKIDELMK